jgi:8-oxo-dGTP pyrophosphatase MutT (NUDIX family)
MMEQMMDATKLKEYIKQGLPEILHGSVAQLKLMPEQNGVIMRDLVPREGQQTRNSAVLLLFDNSFSLPLTVRDPKLKYHGGEICFPGGQTENNETAIETALREAQEEINLDGSNVEILGTLSNIYIPHSNAEITPVIAYTNTLPEFKAEPAEVAEILIVNIFDLAFKQHILYRQETFPFGTFEVPYWEIGEGAKLWGATAMIMNELLCIITEYQRLLES